MINLRPYQLDGIAPGTIIGRHLTIVSPAKSENGGRWNCLCRCGKELVKGNSELNRILKAGRDASCGCARKRFALDGLAKCCKCKERLPELAFSKGNFRCKKCHRAWREAHPELLENLQKNYYARNRASILAKAKQRPDKEGSNRRSAAWRARNPEKRKAVARNWAKRNLAYCCFSVSKRRARILRAIPAWADENAVRLIYRRARELRLTVDHIVPLVSKYVCGLHCEDNLQFLTHAENTRKNNREWPDMP